MRKVLFILVLSVVALCLFALGVSADVVYKNAQGDVLFTGVDENGEPLDPIYPLPAVYTAWLTANKMIS